MPPSPLPANSPLLRRKRYEVLQYHAPLNGRHRPFKTGGEPDRFATLQDAYDFAGTLQAPVIHIVLVTPRNSRFPSGPWARFHLATITH